MDESARVLLVEDEAGLAMTVVDRLEAEGYRCDTAADGETGFAAACDGNWDLILLDVMLPRKSGFDICRDLRARGKTTPVLMLTARGQVIDRILGLKLGADDYLCKPFDMAELLARVEALLRRSAVKALGPAPIALAATGAAGAAWDRAADRGRLDFASFTVDFAKGEISRGTEIHPLSGQEYKLLAFFCEHPNEIVSRDKLLDAVWGYGSDTTTRTIDVHVAALRRKLGDREPLPRHIRTVRGLGYRFVP